MKWLPARYDLFFVALWGALLFLPFLGSVHLFDWDEINFAESAREMIVTGNYQKVQINYQPFMEKPPLFFWLQVLCMKAFGINEFAARLPNAVVGIITLILIFSVGRKLLNREFAWLWVICITGSFTPHLYFKSGIIDPLYNLFIFTSIWQLYNYVVNKRSRHALYLGLFTGLAIITKGPVAVVVIVLCFLTLWAVRKFSIFFRIKDIFVAAFAALIVSSAWFGVETIERGPTFLREFFNYQVDLFLNPVAGHGQPFWYHPLVLLVGCFPASVVGIFFIFRRETEQSPAAVFFGLMQVMFWVVLILFSIVETKIVHYSSLCYLPLTFIAGYYIYKIVSQGQRTKLIQTVMLVFIGSIASLLFILVPLIDHYKASVIPLIKDPFAVACLAANGGWEGYEWIWGALLFCMLICTCMLINRGMAYRGIVTLFIFISCFIPLVMKTIVPKIENYSQAPAIRFFEGLARTDAYKEVLGYKSYAPYFYAKIMPYENQRAYDMNWLLHDSTDKDAYFVSHINFNASLLDTSIKMIDSEGGFTFYKRNAIKKAKTNN